MAIASTFFGMAAWMGLARVDGEWSNGCDAVHSTPRRSRDFAGPTMLDRWFSVIKLPLSWRQFHQLPRNPAYKYEYLDKTAWLSPRPKFYNARLAFSPRGTARPGRSRSIAGSSGSAGWRIATGRGFRGRSPGRSTGSSRSTA